MSGYSILGSDDPLLTLPEVAALMPRRSGGKKMSTSTLWRWAKRGSRGVFLRTVAVGGRVYVPRSAIEDFIAQRSAVRSVPQSPSPTVASHRAIARLEKMGL